jgi:ATP/maltotriose-dependent transcriptional regulator MalT
MAVPQDCRRDALVVERETAWRSLGDPSSASVAALRAVVELDNAIRAHDDGRRIAELDGLVAIHEAISSLRQPGTPEALIDGGAAALLRGTGFTRAMLSCVRHRLWDPVVLATKGDSDPEADAFRDYVSLVKIPLEHMRLETEMARRRMPLLVSSPRQDARAFSEIVDQARTTSYVAAPLVSSQRVIGFIHADRFGSDRECDDADREAIWVFAEHFALLYERAVFIERLNSRRVEIRHALEDAAESIDELCRRDLALAHGERTATASRALPRRGSLAQLVLSAREREVLEGLAAGLTNAQLARDLVLSEATIKSHLKRINRKLHTSGRSGAVAAFLRLASQPAGDR